MQRLLRGLRAKFWFHDYKPQPVSLFSAMKWMGQFEGEESGLAFELLKNVIYLSEKQTREILVHQNNILMEDLRKLNIPPRKLIYVSTDDAGSSSPEILVMLRNSARLEQQGCRLLDGKDLHGLSKATRELEKGAIVYVDDFVGSGNQFATARTFALQAMVGTFSEFLLVPSICEEGYAQLSGLGVKVYSGHIHSKAERPLHQSSLIFDKAQRELLSARCATIRAGGGLGYEGMATMVVLYRNSPNNLPAVLRGSDKQDPFYGIFPRHKDLPIHR